MKNLRLRIIVTWVCFLVIAVSLVLHLAPLLACTCCLIISTVRRFLKPAFPRGPLWFERFVYVLLLPAIFLLALGFWFGFIAPWPYVAKLCLRICLPPLLGLAAYEDLKIWRMERSV